MIVRFSELEIYLHYIYTTLHYITSQEVLLEIWEFLSRTFSCRTGVGLHGAIESDYLILIMFV